MFQQIREAAAFLEDLGAPWWFAGGWAIDLALGRATRTHHDIDIALLRTDQARLRERLAGFRVEVVVGGLRTTWEPGETLRPPVHEIHARHPDRFPDGLEFVLNESHEGLWFYRRNRVVTRPLASLGGVTADGLPYLAPEVVLLYKAPHAGPKDERDFEVSLLALSGQRRLWLARALRTAHPGHPWIDRL